MTTINKDQYSGGRNITEGSGLAANRLPKTQQDIADDLAELRTQIIALLAKMDTDFTAQNAAVTSSQLDVDYESTITPAAMTTIKGTV